MQILTLSIVALINVMQYLSVTIFLSSNTYECFAILINVYLNSVKEMKKVEHKHCFKVTRKTLMYRMEILPAYHNIIFLAEEIR